MTIHNQQYNQNPVLAVTVIHTSYMLDSYYTNAKQFVSTEHNYKEWSQKTEFAYQSKLINKNVYTLFPKA